jgi:hypothetical protein
MLRQEQRRKPTLLERLTQLNRTNAFVSYESQHTDLHVSSDRSSSYND